MISSDQALVLSFAACKSESFMDEISTLKVSQSETFALLKISSLCNFLFTLLKISSFCHFLFTLLKISSSQHSSCYLCTENFSGPGILFLPCLPFACIHSKPSIHVSVPLLIVLVQSFALAYFQQLPERYFQDNIQ